MCALQLQNDKSYYIILKILYVETKMLHTFGLSNDDDDAFLDY